MNLQDLVDDLAVALDRPVSVEDRRWRLLSFSAHTAIADDVRRASILTRSAPAEVVAWLESLDLAGGGELVEVPANPALGMVTRVCAPARYRRALLGYLWVLVGDRPLDEAERGRLVDVARQAGMVLWRDRVLGEEARRRQGELLRELLLDDVPDRRGAAALRLGAEQGWAPRGEHGVLVASVDGEDGDELVDFGERIRRRWSAGRLLWLVHGGHLVVLVALDPDRRESLDDAMRVLRDAGAGLVGAAEADDGLAGAHEALRRAAAARCLLERVPSLGVVRRWEDLGSWALIADMVGPSAPHVPELIRGLLERPDGPALLEAAEAALDHGGDVASIAAALNIHRATLYRRLRRIEELTGLSVGRGDDRLVLHLGLRLWRLAGGGRPRSPR